MIDVSSQLRNALLAPHVHPQDLYEINLGDAYGDGNDFILYLTDCSYPLTVQGQRYEVDRSIVGIDGISRKAQTGSDEVDIEFSIADVIVKKAIEARRYSNKKTIIKRVLLDENGQVINDESINVRTAWAVAHAISGDNNSRKITLTIDSSLGDLQTQNAWYALESSHLARYPNDRIMRHSATAFSSIEDAVFTTTATGQIVTDSADLPSLPIIYGRKDAKLVPICMLTHRKSHSSYRHYFTTFIYVVTIGEAHSVDINNLKKDGEKFDFTVVNNSNQDIGGWSVRLYTPPQNSIDILDRSGLRFFFEQMSTAEKQRFNNMRGQGLTLLFVKNRNRDAYISKPPSMTVPTQGKRVFDPRTGTTIFSRNPALSLYDYINNETYGAANKGIVATESNFIDLANHYENLPNSSDQGISKIFLDLQISTGETIADNLNVWLNGARMYASDTSGQYTVKPETTSTVVLEIDESELLSEYEHDAGSFTDRYTQLTYTTRQLVPDTSEDAQTGDLISVNVEATFPPNGSELFNRWFDEDGGIVNFESETLEHVTELEQAFYWAMVDARISRYPDEYTLPVGAIGWIVEGGDVVKLNKLDGTSELLRVLEANEDRETSTTELECTIYKDEFYSPDQNAISAPIPYAQPPRTDRLEAILGFDVLVKENEYYLYFQALTESNVNYYAIEIYDLDNNLIFDEPQLSYPPMRLSGIVPGEYRTTVVPVGHMNEGVLTEYSFTISDLITPTDVANTAGSVPGRIVVEPPTLPAIFQSYEFRYYTSADSTLRNWGQARILNLSPVVEDVTYFIQYRAIHILNADVTPGQWVTAQVNAIEETFYTWIAYADDDQGAGISSEPEGKAYYGIATNRTIPQWSPSASPLDDTTIYAWRLQPDGANSQPALNITLSNEAHTLTSAQNGQVQSFEGAQSTVSILIGQVNDTEAWNISASPSAGLNGTLTDATFVVTALSTDSGYVDFTASRVGYATLTKRFTVVKVRNGDTGPQGERGEQGIPGGAGPNGQTSYLHIAYANNIVGTSGFTTGLWNNHTHIGTYTDFNVNDSTDPSAYTWALFQGPTGPQGPRGLRGLQGLQGPTGNQGISGPTGPNGNTSYFHIAYADSSNGQTNFTTGAPGSRTYIGTYVDFNSNDSTNPSSYDWALIQGPQGPQGPNGNQGIPGSTGPNGQTSYLHIAYANNSTGTSGFTTGFWGGQSYIGTYTDFNVNDSTNPSNYDWALFQGPRGEPGTPGEPGGTLDFFSLEGTLAADTSNTNNVWRTVGSLNIPDGDWRLTCEVDTSGGGEPGNPPNAQIRFVNLTVFSSYSSDSGGTSLEINWTGQRRFSSANTIAVQVRILGGNGGLGGPYRIEAQEI